MKIFNIQYPIFFVLFFVFCSSFFVVVPVLAAPAAALAAPNFSNALNEAGTVAGGAGVEKGLEPEVYAAKLVTGALSIVGVIFFMLMVYGGYVWMMAKGDETEAKKAQNIITMAVIGIIVVIAAYAATRFVVDKIIGAAV